MLMCACMVCVSYIPVRWCSYIGEGPPKHCWELSSAFAAMPATHPPAGHTVHVNKGKYTTRLREGGGGELQYLRLLYQPTSLFKSNYTSISHCFYCLVLMNGLKKLHSWFMSRRTCAPWWYSMNNTDQGHKRVWISGWVNLPRSGGFCICEMSVPKPAPWITTNDAYKIKTHFLLNFVRHIVHVNPRPPQATKATRCNWRISRQDNNVMWHRFALVLRIKYMVFAIATKWLQLVHSYLVLLIPVLKLYVLLLDLIH